MPRPRKPPSDKRDRKIIVWVTAAEQARFLVNATRVGMTGPDYVRAVSCGGNLRATNDHDAPERIVLAPTRLELAALMARAGSAGLPLDRYLVRCGLADGSVGPPTASFELIDALVRTGTELQRLIDIATATGIVPEEVRDTAAKIERVLDRLLS
jgi:hypothetical protein